MKKSPDKLRFEAFFEDSGACHFCHTRRHAGFVFVNGKHKSGVSSGVMRRNGTRYGPVIAANDTNQVSSRNGRNKTRKRARL